MVARFTDASDMESAEMMSRLDGQANRLTKLINDLLDVTKLTEGQLQMNLKEVDLANLIATVTGETQHTTRNKIVLVPLPPLPRITGDKERLSQVLINLLSNAIKYSPGRTDVQIEVSVNEADVRIMVTDAGIGMSEGTQKRLFERFFRSEDRRFTSSYPGMGLGLYISSQIMQKHNGSILVKSEPGEGSTFTMVLPTTG